jgi:hypothetical protein
LNYRTWRPRTCVTSQRREAVHTIILAVSISGVWSPWPDSFERGDAHSNSKTRLVLPTRACNDAQNRGWEDERVRLRERRSLDVRNLRYRIVSGDVRTDQDSRRPGVNQATTPPQFGLTKFTFYPAFRRLVSGPWKQGPRLVRECVPVRQQRDQCRPPY